MKKSAISGRLFFPLMLLIKNRRSPQKMGVIQGQAISSLQTIDY